MRKISVVISIVAIVVVISLLSLDVLASDKCIVKEEYTWTMADGKKETISVEIDMDAYYYYLGNENKHDGIYHGCKPGTYIKCYLEESTISYWTRTYYGKKPYNYNLSSNIADSFRNIQREYGWDDYRLASEIVSFVQQNIEYEYDNESRGVDEYVKYPVETLADRTGDCEDSSILLASILRRCGFDVAIIDMNGHVAVGIAGKEFSGYGIKDDTNKKLYYYIESTGEGWAIGTIPKAVRNIIYGGSNNIDEIKAELYTK